MLEEGCFDTVVGALWEFAVLDSEGTASCDLLLSSRHNMLHRPREVGWNV